MRKFLLVLGLVGAYFSGIYSAFLYVSKKLAESVYSIEGEVINPFQTNWAIGNFLAKNSVKVEWAGSADAFYFAPAPSEVWGLIKDMKPPLPYKTEVFDCDDFADYFRGELERRWASRLGAKFPLPIITVWAKIQLRNGEIAYHAFNGIIMAGGKIAWIEPQGPAVFRRQIKILEIARLSL